MTSLKTHESGQAQGTSAAMPLRSQLPGLLLLVGVSQALHGTSGASLLSEQARRPALVSPTSTGLSVAPREADAGEGSVEVHALRRLSGLTWEQLAEIFGVNRRSVHFWASGKPMKQKHHDQLVQVLDTLRQVDRGDAKANRRLLLTPVRGTTPMALLASRDYAQFLLVVGDRAEGVPVVAHRPVHGSQRAHPPLPAPVLAGAEAVVHPGASGKRLASTPIQRRHREG